MSKPVVSARSRGFVQGDTVEQNVGQARSGRAGGKKAERGVARGVGVDQKDPLTEVGQTRGQVDGRRAFADASLCVGDGHATHDPNTPLGDRSKMGTGTLKTRSQSPFSS